MGISDEYVCHRTGSPYTLVKTLNNKLSETIRRNVAQTFTVCAAKQQ